MDGRGGAYLRGVFSPITKRRIRITIEPMFFAPPLAKNMAAMSFGTKQGHALRDKTVVFSKSASKVELTLDYFRKVEPAAPVRPPVVQTSVNAPAPGNPGPQTPPVPSVLPQAPRRPHPTQP